MISVDEVKELRELDLDHLIEQLFDLVFDFFRELNKDTIDRFVHFEKMIWNCEGLTADNAYLVYDFIDFIEIDYTVDVKKSPKYALAKKIILVEFIKEKLKTL